MKTKALITSCSDKFFPSVINLLTSIKVNYPNHPPIYVYDLGLFYTFRKELEMIEGVTVVSMPHFCPHWRSCYTWKTYIFSHPPAELNFYIDAGCQVLKPLDEDFDIINTEGMLLIDTKCLFKDLVPSDYRSIIGLKEEYNNETTFSAGIIGFSNTPDIMKIFSKSYEAAIMGLTLGFSPNNAWRNKGKDKNIFIRKCDFFRHDQTIINMFYKKYLPNKAKIQSHDNYSYLGKNQSPTQRIWHLRLLYRNLEFLRLNQLHKKIRIIFMVNRVLIYSLLIVKNISNLIKSPPSYLSKI